jgi:oligopeptide/dipeptide ABC transporter ATP-binding protein
MNEPEPLLEVTRLSVQFRWWRHKPVAALTDVSLEVLPGETVGLVGESGSGKTTLGRAVLGLVRPTSGSILFAGRDITGLSFRDRRSLSADMQVVFQDPYSSLNPRRTVGQTLAEQLVARPRADRRASGDPVTAALARVGLPAQAASRYPAAFSGGQRQRIAIARALTRTPRFVICDEPVSSLDLSIQAQVLNLMKDLQAELGMSYLFISHDMAVIRYMAHRVVVLYQGQVMEAGRSELVASAPAHPYTRALIAAVPVPDPARQAQRRAEREQSATRIGATPADLAGCPFAPRCPHVIDRCFTERPLPETDERGVLIACHRYRELGSSQTQVPVTSDNSS